MVCQQLFKWTRLFFQTDRQMVVPLPGFGAVFGGLMEVLRINPGRRKMLTFMLGRIAVILSPNKSS